MDTWNLPKLLPEGQKSLDLAEHRDCLSKGGEGTQKAQSIWGMLGQEGWEWGFIPKSPLQISAAVPREAGGSCKKLWSQNLGKKKKRWNHKTKEFKKYPFLRVSPFP